MLHATQVSPAIRMAQQFDARGLFIDVDAATPLAALVDTHYLSQSDVIKMDTGMYEPNKKFIIDQSTQFGANLKGEAVPHTEKLEDLADAISAEVVRHLAYVRSTAIPLYEEIATRYENACQKYVVDATGGVQIVPYELPALARDAQLRDALMELSGKPASVEVKYLMLPDRSAEAIKSLLGDAFPSLQADVQAWVETKGDDWLSRMWDICFTSKPTDGADFEVMKMGEDGLDVSLFTFLACTALHDNPPEGINVTRSEYNLNNRLLRNRAALRLNYLITEYDAMVKTDMLILSVGQVVRVVSDVYKKFIEDGGNNTLIHACLLESTPPRNASSILANVKELNRKWRTHLTILEATTENNKYRIMRDHAHQVAREVIAENFQKVYAGGAVQEGVDETNGNYIEFKRRLDGYMKLVRFDDLKSPWLLSRKIICDCVFFFADCVKIMINGIEEAKQSNPDLDVGECSLLAAYGYVFDYVIDMVTVKKMG